jgi:caffeoyl-CoA O-methyltransferase
MAGREILMKLNLIDSFVCLATVALLSAGACAVRAQEPNKTSAEFRRVFLEKFQWTSMNTTAGDAMLLRILIETRGAQRGVEVGTNSGYGAINMGIGFERTGGHLYTVEISPRMVQTARQNLEKVGLEKIVTVLEGDALKVLPTLEGEFDFVFLDALKPDYLKYLKLLEPKIKRGATLVADNVIESARQMQDFLEYVQSSPNYDTVIIRASLQKNDGMSVSYKIR